MATVVLAEDDEDIRALTVRILRRAGHTVVATADGAAALQAVRDHTPHLVLSDIDMPIMSGLDLCRALRHDADTRSLPVVLISGSLLPGDTRPAEVDATAFLRKPFGPNDLVECVAKALSTGHQSGQRPAGRE